MDDHEDAGAASHNWRDEMLIPRGDISPELYPRLSSMSAAFLYDGIVRPVVAAPPEYVALRLDLRDAKSTVEVSQWNILWEAAQFRRRYFDEDDLSAPLRKIAELGDVNVSIVPRTASRYYEYAPLMHLLPVKTLDAFGLPLLRAGQWPFLVERVSPDSYLPARFSEVLGRAWATQVWPHLVSGSSIRAFSRDDPIRMLSHNLDFWLPPVTKVMQARLAEFGRVDKGLVSVGRPVKLTDGSVLDGAIGAHPLRGGDIWTGERDAADLVSEAVEVADHDGRLRDIVDAVRANRVEDDFSPRWSYAREDFERKLYRKRSKVKVRFVELTDTIPVQGPDSEVDGAVITNDFLSFLDRRNREIVVLLNSGYSKTEVARELGYANHSPVSKRLVKIRREAAKYFDED